MIKNENDDNVFIDFENCINSLIEPEENIALCNILRKIKEFSETILIQEFNKTNEISIINCILKQILLWVINFTENSFTSPQKEDFEKQKSEYESLISIYRGKIKELESECELKTHDIQKMHKNIESKNSKIIELQVKIEELENISKNLDSKYIEQIEGLKNEISEKDRLFDEIMNENKNDKNVCLFCKKMLENSQIIDENTNEFSDAYFSEIKKKIIEKTEHFSSYTRNLQNLLNTVKFLKSYLSEIKYNFTEMYRNFGNKMIFFVSKYKELNKSKQISLCFKPKINDTAIFIKFNENYILLNLYGMNSLLSKKSEYKISKKCSETVILLDIQKLPFQIQKILTNFNMLVIGTIKNIYDCDFPVQKCELSKIQHIIGLDENCKLINYEFD